MEEMIKAFKSAAIEEPGFIPFGVTECLVNILASGDDSVPRSEKATQSTINNYMCKLGKRYNKKLAILVPTGRDNFIYDSSRLFPVSTYEWILANMEFYCQHYIGLFWLGDKIFHKASRILRQRYGKDYEKEVVSIVKQSKEDTKLNWNVTLYEMIETFIEGIRDRDTNIEKVRFSKEFTHLLLSTFYFTWGAKEVTDMASTLKFYSEKYSLQTSAAIIYLTLSSYIGPRTEGSGRNR